ncbi:hypothetical protein ACP70R_047099 [Stipagrostis hirtigluma subsp. patula]
MGPSMLELRRMSKGSVMMGQAAFVCGTSPGEHYWQPLQLQGICVPDSSSSSSKEDIIHDLVDVIEKRLREITVSDVSRKDVREFFLMPPREDLAVWVLVSSASVAEYQHDLRAKEHNVRSRLALLAKKRIFMEIFSIQGIRKQTFAKYDYGWWGNIKHFVSFILPHST